ncbi:tetratricopeptide repeat protein [Thiotrichales bacterium HSG1]|nr:tetratricopeptide repeat protein [Thiotrichales bacterium HSG1]
MTDIHKEPDYLEIPDDLLEQKPNLKHLANELTRAYAARDKLVTEDDLQAMGQALWSGEITPPQDKIRPVIIASNKAEIQALPWECLYHPDYKFLAKELGFTLSRCLPAIKTETNLTAGPLRVLLFSSLPDDVSRLDIEEEQAQVLIALNEWVQQGWVKLDVLDDGRYQTLVDKLQENQYHLVFLSGHGQYNAEQKYGVFYFEDQQGKAEPVVDSELAKAFIGRGVQCVVLSACESAKATTGLAQALVQQGITHVVGMRESILDKAGIAFAKSFCGRIGRKERVDIAVQAARRAILTGVKDTVTLRDLNKDLSHSAELSQNQWCLPLLFSQDLTAPLVDWDFTPQPVNVEYKLRNIWEGIPDFATERFIGRRSELRELGSRFVHGSQAQLLITGPGGQGKTALATRLAQRLEHDGYTVVTYVAKPENSWQSFLFKLKTKVLTGEFKEEFKQNREFCETPEQEAEVLLDLLLRQTKGKVLFFFDNLESIQDANSRELNHSVLNIWLTEITRAGSKLLLTSRYRLPGWDGERHHALQKANFFDFTYYLQRQNLALEHDLQRLYQDLNGNFRGVIFFLTAQAKNPEFKQSLQQAQQDLYVDMAIAALFELLTESEQQLLARLPAYQSPVPLAGIEALQSQALIQNLLDYSLLEVQLDLYLNTEIYQVSSLVKDWLQPNIGKEDYAEAARYQKQLFYTDKDTVGQALDVHQALLLAEEVEEARRFALDEIVSRFDMAGLYHDILTDWLPDILQTTDEKLKGDALNKIGEIRFYIGDYNTALSYLEQSLLITREIGDKQGEGTALNNISQIYDARGDYNTTLSYLKQSLLIRREIGDKKGEGTTSSNIGSIYYSRSDYDKALEYFEQTITIFREIGDKASEGTILNNISAIFQAKGDYDKALSYLEQSLTIVREIGDKKVEGTILNNFSQIFQAKGDYDIALSYLEQSLAIVREIGDKQGEGRILNNIFLIFQAKGDYDTALSYLEQSLTIVREIGDKQSEGTILNNFSQIFQAKGDYDIALSYLEQSLTIVREIGDKKVEGVILNNIFLTFQAKGDYDTALSYLEQSLTIVREIGDTSGLCNALFNIAHIHLAKQEPEQAREKFVQAYKIASEIGLHQVLQALEQLANDGGKDGLNFWKEMAGKM